MEVDIRSTDGHIIEASRTIPPQPADVYESAIKGLSLKTGGVRHDVSSVMCPSVLLLRALRDCLWGSQHKGSTAAHEEKNAI